MLTAREFQHFLYTSHVFDINKVLITDMWSDNYALSFWRVVEWNVVLYLLIAQ